MSGRGGRPVNGSRKPNYRSRKTMTVPACFHTVVGLLFPPRRRGNPTTGPDRRETVERGHRPRIGKPTPGPGPTGGKPPGRSDPKPRGNPGQKGQPEAEGKPEAEGPVNRPSGDPSGSSGGLETTSGNRGSLPETEGSPFGNEGNLSREGEAPPRRRGERSSDRSDPRVARLRLRPTALRSELGPRPDEDRD